MKKFFVPLSLFCLLFILFSACKKRAFDEYYARPDNLPSSIYSVLQGKGNFTNLLAAIDKAGYKNTLNGAGYWTFFAPDDEAFKSYFTSKNISSVANMDSAQCRKIVTYCLVYYAYKKDRIADYQASTGWVENVAFRRRTAKYTGVYNDTNNTGTPIKAIASNRNGAVYYANNDNNFKYIPYFVDDFMSAKSLTAADYQYFYNNSNYTGFNVAQAAVKEKDILAENGIIHVIDKVIEALPSIDEYLNDNPEYSLFNSLYQKYLVSFAQNQTVAKNYQLVNGGSDMVYTKVYHPSLAFALNNESYLAPPGNDAQQGCYSIFAPKNAVLQAYIDTVLLEHYKSLDEMPPSIIYDLLNAHMWQVPVWPSKFNITYNFVNEEARFNPTTNITDKQILSNGIFYGTNKVQDANIFSSVYGKAYLDPEYSMMLSLLNLELRPSVSNIYNKYTIFMISNKMFNDAGYFADPSISNVVIDQWRFTPPPGSTVAASTGSTTRARLQRILNLHVIPNQVLASLSGTGIAMSYGGEYIKYNNNTIVAAGNVDVNETVNVLSSKMAKNGKVYYTDRLLAFSEETVGQDIERLGTPTTSQFNYFWQYLKNSTTLWNNTTKLIAGVNFGSFYTVFIPNNAAILKAVNDGNLPGTGVAPNRVPNINPTSAVEKQQVERFILYHILDKRTVGTDGVESGAFPSILKNNVGEATTIFVTNTVGNLNLRDMNGRQANTILASSNYLANRAVIHLIDNYLQYIY